MMKVKEMSEAERPREKAILNGIESISNRDLLAIIIRSGTKGSSAMQLADHILMLGHSLCDILSLDMSTLTTIKGIKETKALQILACFELSKRIAFDQSKQERIQVNHPKVIVDWLNKEIGFSSQEHFIVIFLDNKNHIISYKTLFIGSLNASVVHPREVYKEAIEKKAAKIMVAHNHPSGDPQPSENDIITTRCLKETGDIVGIPLLDHIIVGKNNYISFAQKLLID
ncbi:MAG: DNA repair protein RadC [Erysipelotrichaceae bacterium]